ncbi:formyltransferase family protein [Alphaproteobacteria bacterium]|nr:formyltransferase family protein [Alphaproteobacteria bacterium]
MNILIIGSVKFSENAMRHLINGGFDVVGVVGKEDGGFNSDFVDLVPIALELGIDAIHARDVNSKNIRRWIELKSPDVIMCLGWSRLLGAALLNIPKICTIGYHPSELPHNRGRHPLIWAIALGMENTASTFFLMDEGVDSGKVISQESLKILPDDSAEQVYERMTSLALRQLSDFVPKLNENFISQLPLNVKQGNIWRKRSEADGRIDWRMRAADIHNLVRALSKPYPGAFFNHGALKITVWEAKEIELHGYSNIEPGRILSFEQGRYLVKCSVGAIEILSMEPEIDMSSIDYFLY